MPTAFRTGASPPGTWPGKNPTGDVVPPALPVPEARGTVTVAFPPRPLDVTPAPGTVTLTALIRSIVYFRDVQRQIPAGASISTMHGPLASGDLPYPAGP